MVAGKEEAVSETNDLQDLLTLNVLCYVPDTEVVNLENPRLAPEQRYPLDDNPYPVLLLMIFRGCCGWRTRMRGAAWF